MVGLAIYRDLVQPGGQWSPQFGYWMGRGKVLWPKHSGFLDLFYKLPRFENVGFDRLLDWMLYWIKDWFIFRMFSGFERQILARQVLDVSQNKLETISAEHLKGRPSGGGLGAPWLVWEQTQGFSERFGWSIPRRTPCWDHGWLVVLGPLVCGYQSLQAGGGKWSPKW